MSAEFHLRNCWVLARRSQHCNKSIRCGVDGSPHDAAKASGAATCRVLIFLRETPRPGRTRRRKDCPLPSVGGNNIHYLGRASETVLADAGKSHTSDLVRGTVREAYSYPAVCPALWRGCCWCRFAWRQQCRQGLRPRSWCQKVP